MSQANLVKDEVIQQQILEAAKRLFQVYGLQKVTMDDVAKAIGKGRSSLYYYYKSKDEIFDAVVNIDIREMLAAVSTAVEKAKTAEEKIHAFCVSKLNVSQEKQSFYSTLDIGMDADAVSHLNKTKIIYHNLIMKLEGDVLGQILDNGVESGELKPFSEKEKATLIFVLLSSLHGLKREMRLENTFDHIEATVNMLSRMIVYGLKR